MGKSTVIYTKIGEHRGKQRLWLEGNRLARTGITPGQRFNLVAGRKSLTLQFTEDGAYKVSRRKRGEVELPVIDITAAELAQALGKVERVRVVVRGNRVDITIHHHDLAESDRMGRLLQSLTKGEPLEIGSIAHGAGVLDHAIHTGLADVGMPSRLAFANELEGAYLEASLANNPVWDEDSIAIQGPMEEVEWHKLPFIHLLCAGLPCTGASLSGRAKNKLDRAEAHETAGSLFIAFMNAIQTLRPAMVLLENVPQYQTTASMTVIRSVLSSIGYDVHETILDGYAMGSLERRNRLCMLAVSKGIEVDLEALEPVRQRETLIAEVLEPFQAVQDRFKPNSYLADKEARDLAAGKGFRRQLLDGSEGSLGTIGRGYSKARSTEPFLRHPDDSGQSRLLTKAEHARVKTVPEMLVQGLSETVSHELLGQGVVHCAFRAVGRLIGNCLHSIGEQDKYAWQQKWHKTHSAA
ncbi:MAG: DNA cytosine methyltransferase [Halomonas sp.]|nr:DNA cytosine methyltransferase [Halomonas sp.]MBL1267701.1 DNA cytosine methyltransferase [Halomonas sp.]